MLIGLFPALMWGILPIILTKLGGRPIQQMIGTTLGSLIVALICLLFSYHTVVYSLINVLLCFISGIFWSVGQLNQYRAIEIMGVSQTMPLATGLLLISNSLFGVVVFGDWAIWYQKILGFGAIALIVFGVFLTSYQTKRRSSKEICQLKRSIVILLFSTLGYMGYATLPNFTNSNGWSAFLPQVSGMVIGTLLQANFVDKQQTIFGYESWRHLVSGFIFAIGALGYLISLKINGVAVGYTLSQMGVIISTVGGILFLKEHKNHKELNLTIIGLLLMSVAAVMVGLTKS
jgi:glucose uptake protein